MVDWVPFYTQDGSVGLYSEKDNDIYHSVYGAASEAYHKFILPSNFDEYFKNNNEIKILDLCYGIGYNTKIFLNEFLKNFPKCTENNYSIYTDNVSVHKNNVSIHADNIIKLKNNCSIYSNKIFNKYKINKQIKNIQNYKIQIDAVDTNELLMKLSPFFNICRGRFNQNATGVEYIDKLLKNITDQNLKNNFYNFYPEVNMIILCCLLKYYGVDYISRDFLNIVNDKIYTKYFSKVIMDFMPFYFSRVCNLSSEYVKSTFLHNIYYEYISASYKNTLKILKNNEISINCISQDAREFLLANDKCYDFIFLDAFSPHKSPNLWTYEFFSLLYKHLSPNGKFLTYSNASPIRNAMLKNNFFIAKIFNQRENKFTGTIAVKNPELIKNNLTDYDYGLLNTKAGIMYRDENLSASNSKILSIRENEIKNSDLLSTTQYKNKYKGALNGI
ncbi:hypothetical protein IKE67_04160 [bacterium]|nr:hypothetical protein [bacterium]